MTFDGLVALSFSDLIAKMNADKKPAYTLQQICDHYVKRCQETWKLVKSNAPFEEFDEAATLEGEAWHYLSGILTGMRLSGYITEKEQTAIEGDIDKMCAVSHLKEEL